MINAAGNVGDIIPTIDLMRIRIIGTWNVAKRREQMSDRKIYKDEDTQTICEYLKEFDAETEKRKAFSNALKRKLLEKHYLEEELARCKKELKYYEEQENEI